MFTSALAVLSIVGLALAGVIPAPTLVRIPSQDSAVIQHERLGGNFAYSAHEAHAYGVQTPIVEQRVYQQGVTFHQGTPQVRTHTTVQKHLVPQYAVVKTQHTIPSVQYVSQPGVAVLNQPAGVAVLNQPTGVAVLNQAPVQLVAGPTALLKATNPSHIIEKA